MPLWIDSICVFDSIILELCASSENILHTDTSHMPSARSHFCPLVFLTAPSLRCQLEARISCILTPHTCRFPAIASVTTGDVCPTYRAVAFIVFTYTRSCCANPACSLLAVVAQSFWIWVDHHDLFYVLTMSVNLLCIAIGWIQKFYFSLTFLVGNSTNELIPTCCFVFRILICKNKTLSRGDPVIVTPVLFSFVAIVSRYSRAYALRHLHTVTQQAVSETKLKRARYVATASANGLFIFL